MSQGEQSSVKTAAGLADLVRALAAQPPSERWARLDACAQLLGLQRAMQPPTSPRRSADQQQEPAQPESVRALVPPPPRPHDPAASQTDLAPTPFWRAVAFELYDDPEPNATEGPEEVEPEPLRDSDLTPQLASVPEAPALEPWSRLWPRLACHLVTQRRSRIVDSAALVRRWSRALPLARIPRLQRRAWAGAAVIVQDRRAEQRWLLEDQAWLLRKLRRIMGKRSVSLQLLSAGPDAPLFDTQRRCYGALKAVERDTPLLLLSSLMRPAGEAEDMAGSVHATGDEAQAWRRLGQRLVKRGYRAAVLVAVPQARALRGLWPHWQLIPWQQDAWQRRRTPQQLTASAERLLTLAAPAAVVSAPLLRALRRLLPATEADAGTEADVWAHPDVKVTPYGLRLLPGRAQYWLELFEALGGSPHLQHEAWRLIRHHQGLYGHELNQLCRLRLLSLPKGAVLSQDEARNAIAFAQRLNQAAEEVPLQSLQGRLRRWFRAYYQSIPLGTWEHPQAGEPLRRFLVRAMEEGDAWPAALDPRLLPQPPKADQVRDVCLIHRDGGLWRVEPGAPGSPVGLLRLREDKIMQLDPYRAAFTAEQPLNIHTNTLELGTDMSRLRLEQLTCPPWALDIGRDDYGLFVLLVIEGVEMRMRWIPPGRFMMGSPPEEQGRYDDEGPQQEVVLTHGFWLGETPCTQQLWRAVMGDNPSRFKSADRPVEQVSFEDVARFMDKLNGGAVGGPKDTFRLPTEAEWEYACRAGTRDATYAGPMAIRGNNDAPVLDHIAWYGGNSGVDFELENGPGTHPVACKRPNQWGLYDMLGNVWEWCADGAESYDKFRPYSPQLAVDPNELPDEGHAGRVVRGGSWGNGARDVRAAYRLANHPANANADLGFRLVRGQELPGAEPAERAQRQSWRSQPRGGRGMRPTSAAGRMPVAAPDIDMVKDET